MNEMPEALAAAASKNGYYDRAIVRAVQLASQKLGLVYEVFAGTWAIKLTKGAKTRYIFANRFDFNNQASCEIARDKAAASEVLSAAGVNNVLHFPLQSERWMQVDPAAVEYAIGRFGVIVVKPLRGRRGQDVAKFSDVRAALSFMEQAGTVIWCASPYIEIQQELRLVVFQGRIRLAYTKFSPALRNGLKLFNLEHGTSAQRLELAKIDPAFAAMATAAMRAIRLELGAVDIVVDVDGKARVLEVNHGFSLNHYGAISESNFQQVVELYALIISAQFAG